MLTIHSFRPSQLFASRRWMRSELSAQDPRLLFEWFMQTKVWIWWISRKRSFPGRNISKTILENKLVTSISNFMYAWMHSCSAFFCRSLNSSSSSAIRSLPKASTLAQNVVLKCSYNLKSARFHFLICSANVGLIYNMKNV